MRVISGQFKGKRLLSPKCDNVRPTTDRIKETIFNILCNKIEIEGSVVLDLFCGSGALGIESLSRGATRAVFIDNNSDSIKLTKQNLEEMGKITIASSLAKFDLPSAKQPNHDCLPMAQPSCNSSQTVHNNNLSLVSQFNCDLSPKEHSGYNTQKEYIACNSSQTKQCRAEVFNTSFEIAIKKLQTERFDIIFIDPPYFDNLGERSIFLIEKFGILAENGIIVYEHYGKNALSIQPKKYIMDTRDFGSVSVSFLIKEKS